MNIFWFDIPLVHPMMISSFSLFFFAQIFGHVLFVVEVSDKFRLDDIGKYNLSCLMYFCLFEVSFTSCYIKYNLAWHVRYSFPLFTPNSYLCIWISRFIRYYVQINRYLRRLWVCLLESCRYNMPVHFPFSWVLHLIQLGPSFSDLGPSFVWVWSFIRPSWALPLFQKGPFVVQRVSFIHFHVGP